MAGSGWSPFRRWLVPASSVLIISQTAGRKAFKRPARVRLKKRSAASVGRGGGGGAEEIKTSLLHTSARSLPLSLSLERFCYRVLRSNLFVRDRVFLQPREYGYHVRSRYRMMIKRVRDVRVIRKYLNFQSN